MDSYNDKKITLYVLTFLTLGLLAFFCFAMLFTAAGYNTFSFSEELNTALEQSTAPVIVIDPGHGGEDPGAVIGDVKEKDINLSVSKRLGELFQSSGYNVIYTRTEDRMLYNQGEENRKKFFDLQNRVNIASSFENAIFISVHVNRFSVEKYSGLQVFYTQNSKNSEKLAKHIQNRIAALQPTNNRKAKDSGSGIYLLDKYAGTAVLIECGFISNETERKKLCDEEYQNKLALNIFVSVSEYINGEKSEN